jgi:hypothetical protein
MTPTERANEHLKLVANWLNTVATAIIAAGAFVPAAQFIFGAYRRIPTRSPSTAWVSFALEVEYSYIWQGTSFWEA